MLNIYLFYRPEQNDRRSIFRKYVKMWRDINPPDMIPFKYYLVTASTPETVQEDLVNEDMLLFEGFDESYMNTYDSNSLWSLSDRPVIIAVALALLLSMNDF